MDGRKFIAVCLLVALIALAAMSMAGVALIRSIDTNSLIAGNLAFRQNSTTSADTGVEAARQWLMTASSAYLQDDHSDLGYYASRADAAISAGATALRRQPVAMRSIWRINAGWCTAISRA